MIHYQNKATINKKLLVVVLQLIIIILLSINSISVSNIDYKYDGVNQYQLGDNIFNKFLTTHTDSTRALTTPIQSPLVVDFNNDGTQEIIAVDGNFIRLYHGNTLDIVDSLNIGYQPEYFITTDKDIDGDIINDSDIYLIDDVTRNLTIVNYNGSVMKVEKSFLILNSSCNSDSGITIGCEASNKCIAFCGHRGNDCGSGTSSILAQGFNASGTTTNPIVAINGNGGGSSCYTYFATPCINRMRTVSIADINNDGKKDYVTSYLQVHTGSLWGNTILIPKVYYFNSTTLNSLTGLSISSGVISTSNLNCNTQIQSSISDIMLGDFDGSISDGLELAIAKMSSTTSFDLYSYNSDNSLLDTHPNSLLGCHGDANYLSNIVKANIFQGSVFDYCVAGYTNNTYQVEIMCGSDTTTEDFDTRVFAFKDYNLTINNNIFNTMIHSTNSIIDTPTNTLINPSEFVTPYGVYEITEYQDGSGLLFCIVHGTNFIGFENPYRSSSIIMSDVQKNGYDDMLLLTNTNLWYLDDNFFNTNAYLFQLTTNPSINNVIKVNQSPQITIQPRDLENDLVETRLITYEGTFNQQDTNWSGFFASGTTFPYTFNANQTGNNYIMKVLVRDNQHNDSINYTFTFSVGLTGGSVGESEFIYSNTTTTTNITTPIGEGGTNVSADNNAITQGTQDLSNTTHLTPMLIMLILMIIATGLGIYLGSKHDKFVLGLIGGVLIDFFLLVIFTYCKLISTAWFIIMLFLLIVFGVLMIYQEWNKNR